MLRVLYLFWSLSHKLPSIKLLLQSENLGQQHPLWMPMGLYIDLRKCFLRKTFYMVLQLDDMGYETQGLDSTHSFCYASLTCGLYRL